MQDRTIARQGGHAALRKKLEAELAEVLYDTTPQQLTVPELADVSRFMELHIMRHVRPYIERNYERKPDEPS